MMTAPSAVRAPVIHASTFVPIFGLQVGALPADTLPRWEPRHLEAFLQQLAPGGFPVLSFIRLAIGSAPIVIGHIAEARLHEGALEVRVSWVPDALALLAPERLDRPELFYMMAYRPFGLTTVYVRKET